jgi:urease accessory protein
VPSLQLRLAGLAVTVMGAATLALAFSASA